MHTLQARGSSNALSSTRSQRHISSRKVNWSFARRYVYPSDQVKGSDIDKQLRRTMQTMLLSYPSLVKRLREQGNPPYLLDIVQEVKAVPSDTPSYPVEKLMTSKDGMFDDLDFSTLSPEYASKEGIYHPDNVRERAKQVRKWLRSRKEQHIVGTSCSPHS